MLPKLRPTFAKFPEINLFSSAKRLKHLPVLERTLPLRKQTPATIMGRHDGPGTTLNMGCVLRFRVEEGSCPMGLVHLGFSKVGKDKKEEQHPDQQDQQEKLSRLLHDMP